VIEAINLFPPAVPNCIFVSRSSPHGRATRGRVKEVVDVVMRERAARRGGRLRVGFLEKIVQLR